MSGYAEGRACVGGGGDVRSRLCLFGFVSVVTRNTGSPEGEGGGVAGFVLPTVVSSQLIFLLLLLRASFPFFASFFLVLLILVLSFFANALVVACFSCCGFRSFAFGGLLVLQRSGHNRGTTLRPPPPPAGLHSCSTPRTQQPTPHPLTCRPTSQGTRSPHTDTCRDGSGEGSHDVQQVMGHTESGGQA